MGDCQSYEQISAHISRRPHTPSKIGDRYKHPNNAKKVNWLLMTIAISSNRRPSKF